MGGDAQPLPAPLGPTPSKGVLGAEGAGGPFPGAILGAEGGFRSAQKVPHISPPRVLLAAAPLASTRPSLWPNQGVQSHLYQGLGPALWLWCE